MDRRLLDLSSREFQRGIERQVEQVFELRRESLNPTYEVPWIGGEYGPRDKRENYAALMRQACRALVAQFWFERTAPSWTWPLPLRVDECEMLIRDADKKMQLVGYFGRSLRWLDWDYNTHTQFHDFCSGVMDFVCAPADMPEDPELLRLFPAKALAGISNPLAWRRP